MHSTVGTEDPNIVPMDFKGKLSRACELRRLTNQRELADLARVSKSSLNRWLQGTSTPSVYEAARLADVLRVPLDWLAKDDDQLEPPIQVELPEDEATVLKFYRILKRTKGINEELAVAGMSSIGQAKPEVGEPAELPGPPPGADPTWKWPLAPRDPLDGIIVRQPPEPDKEAEKAPPRTRRKRQV